MKITNKQIISIGVILLFGGIFLLCNNYFQSKKAKAYDTITLAMSELPTYIEDDTTITDDEIINDDTSDTNNTNNSNTNTNNSSNSEVITPEEYYIGKLEIPTINFSRGFTSLESKYNTVSKNITVISGSTYPDIDNGNFILAGHSGSSWRGFFSKLYKLKTKDKAYIYYNNIKYTYELSDIYEEDKTGYVTIKRNKSKSTLTLITCTKNKNNKQSVYIFYLIDKENY